jgi:hypothetical protein
MDKDVYGHACCRAGDETWEYALEMHHRCSDRRDYGHGEGSAAHRVVEYRVIDSRQD